MVEDSITPPSRFRQMFVIARGSTFVYKGRRVTTPLIDASAGGHLWTERFDGNLANIFSLQERITARVAPKEAPLHVT